MAPPVSLEGRVAVVTGAGQGLGRIYALELASRGAKVVVNDLGTSGAGGGASSSVADKVVEEIQAAGGVAVANYDSVEHGAKIIQTAVESFGRVDVVINNAGILRDGVFKKMTEEDWDIIYKVHMKGVYAITRAAWPYFEKQQYGRVVNISSPSGLYGNFGQVNYSTMKRAVIGFTLALSREGLKKNIKVNVVAPLAASRMLATVMPKEAMDKLKPENVAALIAYLSSEQCEPTGGIFEVAGQWMAKLRWHRSRGVTFDDAFTADDVASRYFEMADFRTEGSEYPEDSSTSFEHGTGGGKSKKSKL